MKHPLLSRGNLTEITPKHFVPDGLDTWTCAECGELFYDDTKVENHPKKNACICLTCLPQYLAENEAQPSLSPAQQNLGVSLYDRAAPTANL